MLDTKNIEAAVIAIAAEQIATMVLRQCIESITFPQNIAPRVTAKFDRNAAIATSRTCPPSAKM
jgi:hypothetical protein